MRLFVAVDISDETRGQLVNVREQLEPALARARQPPRVTWVKPESAHVTLRFVGEVAEQQANALRATISGALDFKPFAVTWNRLGTFPSGRSPRVVWIGASDGADALSALAQLVNERLSPLIGAGDARPFTPHLTVGRIKDPGHAVEWARIIDETSAGSTVSRVDHVTLYQSRTLPQGPAYDPLSTWTLFSR